jgi:WD40 repeat protein
MQRQDLRVEGWSSVVDLEGPGGLGGSLEIDGGTHSGAIDRLLTAAHDDLFCTVGDDRRIRFWRPGLRQPTRTLLTPRGPGSAGSIEACALHHSGLVCLIAVAGSDGTSLLWTYQVEQDRVTSRPWTSTIQALAFDPWDRWLFVVDETGLRVQPLTILDPTGAQPVPEPDVATLPLSSSVLDLAVVELDDGTPRIFLLQADRWRPTVVDLIDDRLELQPEQLNPGFEVRYPERLAAGPDSIAVVGYDRVLVYDLQGHNPRTVPLGPDARPAGAAFTPSGSLLVIGSGDRARAEVTVHAVDEGLRLVGRRVFDGPTRAVGALDEATVVTAGGRSHDLRIWQPRTIGSATGDDGLTSASHDLLVSGQVTALASLALDDDRLFFSRSADAESPDGHRWTGLFDLQALALHQPSSADFDEVRGQSVPEPIQFPEVLAPTVERATATAASSRWLAAAAPDGIVSLWSRADLARRPDSKLADSASPLPALYLFLTVDGDWMLWTPDGSFSASPGADRYLLHVEDQGPDQRPHAVGVDRLYGSLYRPGVIDRIIERGRVDSTSSTDRRLREPLALPPRIDEVVIDRFGDEAVVRFAVIDSVAPDQAAAAEQAANHAVVLVDGLPAWEAEGPVAGAHEAVVWLPPGARSIRVEARSPSARSVPVERLVPPDTILVEPSLGTAEPDLGIAPPSLGTVEPDLGIASDQAGLVVTGGTFQLELSAEVDSYADLVAVRNGREIWAAGLNPGTSVDVAIDVAAVDGLNEIEITRSDHRGQQAIFEGRFTARIEAPTTDPLDANPPPLADPGPPVQLPVDQPSTGQEVPFGSGPEAGPATELPVLREPEPTPPPPDTRPQLFLLSVGVNDLVDNDHSANEQVDGDQPDARPPLGDLRYAVADAEALGHRLSTDTDAFAPGGWQRVLTDAEATKAGIETALVELKAALMARAAAKRSLQLAVRDVVVFFFAGHGVTSSHADGGGEQLYLVTHDYDRNDVAGSCLAMRSVGRQLASLPAEVVVLIDACRSGSTVPTRWRPSNAAEVGNELSSGRDTALYVITATTSKEVAWEDEIAVPYRSDDPDRPKVGHGMFTHGLLKKLEPINDEAITLDELIGGVKKYVRSWTSTEEWRRTNRRMQTPTAHVDRALNVEAAYIEIFKPSTTQG